MNYAAIGSIIGHEITHGFDKKGHQFDKNGHISDWWQKETEEKFLLKAQCVIDKYGNYTIEGAGVNVREILHLKYLKVVQLYTQHWLDAKLKISDDEEKTFPFLEFFIDFNKIPLSYIFDRY